MKTVIALLLIGCTFSSFADDTPPELQRLQKIRAEKIKEIDDAYVRALEKLEAKYAKLGDKESAAAVAAVIEEVEASASETAPEKAAPEKADSQASGSQQPAEITADFDFIPFEEGQNIFNKNEGWPSFDAVPEAYAGREVSVPEDPKDTELEFRVEKEGVVTILVPTHEYYGGKSYSQLKATGWKQIDQITCTSWNDDTFRHYAIMEKPLEKGKHTLLSGGVFGVRVFR